LVHSEKDILLLEKKENIFSFEASSGLYIVSLYDGSQKITSETIIVQ
jgi:hypothetical protein